VIIVGTRPHDGQPDSLGFPTDETAKRHGASVEEDTLDGGVAYASVVASGGDARRRRSRRR
jgi:hypothetical protein